MCCCLFGGISELCRAAAESQLLISFSAITIICGGKEIAHQSEVLGKWPRQRPGAGCLSSRLTGVSRGALCVCERVCFVINHCRFEESERRHTLYPSLLFILYLLPHGRWPSHPIWPSHWGQGQPDHTPPTNNSSPISPLQESTFTPSPLGDVLASHSPHCVPFVHLLSWRLDCHWDHPLLCVCVCVWQRSGQKLK